MKDYLIEIKIRIVDRVLLRIANVSTISYPFWLSGIKVFFLRILGMKISSPCFFDEGFDCLFPKNISVGPQCSFGHNNKFWAFNAIKIGPRVQTAIGLTLVAGGHDPSDYSSKTKGQEITLEGENWIGANVTILGGVVVGKGAIIGAGAVVTKSIPEYTIAAGIPAKVIRHREPASRIVSPFGQYTASEFK